MSSEKTKNLKQSGIRAVSRRCVEAGGINLGQGICDIPTPDLIKEAAIKAICDNHSTYAPHDGIVSLRELVAKKLADFNAINAHPNEVLITHGSTGAFVAAALTLFNPGDEVILFEPFYGYHRGILELNEIEVKTVKTSLIDFSIDWQGLEKIITKKTKGIVVCTPCNPSGKVFTKEELLKIGEIARQHKLYIITDEIYEYITYPGHRHVSLASLEDHATRTITLSGFSKTYNMTGWRLGYATGPAEIIHKMGLVHDLYYICPPTPLQHGVLAAFQLGNDYYKSLTNYYLKKRDFFVSTLQQVGFIVNIPQGAYYILADVSQLFDQDDEYATTKILEIAKVATVPGRAFYLKPEDGKKLVRICFAVDDAKLALAASQLQKLI